ncbi:MAG: RloB domain-containing protein [Leptospiraceae bacterium]|nr:RloB domain-containing protein [Leptospiraceae bacterium]
MSFLKKRKTGTREVREPVLIVCEDSKSSVYYLKEKVKSARLTSTEVEVSGDSNSAPISVVDFAIERKRQQRIKAKKEGIYEYKEIYCVMDVDNHDTLRNAIIKAKDHLLLPIISNESFELWYLLHFTDQNAHIERHKINKKLSEYLGKDYDKADEKIFEYLMQKGNEKNAIERAKKLEKQSLDSDPDLLIKKNPTTDVYVLIEKINELSRNG